MFLQECNKILHDTEKYLIEFVFDQQLKMVKNNRNQNHQNNHPLPSKSMEHNHTFKWKIEKRNGSSSSMKIISRITFFRCEWKFGFISSTFKWESLFLSSDKRCLYFIFRTSLPFYVLKTCLSAPMESKNKTNETIW